MVKARYNDLISFYEHKCCQKVCLEEVLFNSMWRCSTHRLEPYQYRLRNWCDHPNDWNLSCQGLPASSYDKFSAFILPIHAHPFIRVKYTVAVILIQFSSSRLAPPSNREAVKPQRSSITQDRPFWQMLTRTMLILTSLDREEPLQAVSFRAVPVLNCRN